MKPFRRLLVPVDFSDPARTALTMAGVLQTRFGARLDLLHITPEAANGDVHRMMADEMDACGIDSDGVIRTVREGLNVGTGILAHASETHPDLIVMGTEGGRGIERVMMGSVAETVVRHSQVDVLTLRAAPEGAASDLRRMLVGVDLSAQTPGLLRRCFRLAEKLGAHVDVLHVIEPFAFPVSLTGIRTAYDLIPDLRAKVRQRLEAQVRSVGETTVPFSLHLEDGPPAATLLEFAETYHADLLMVATKGRTGVDRFLLGSVAERLVRFAPCPVWTVRANVTSAASADAARGSFASV